MLSDALDAYHGTLCFITHDRTLIREVANKIIEIRNGVASVYAGNYDEFLAWKDRAAILEEEKSLPIPGTSDAISQRELQRRRKAAEGDLRNDYYRVSSPLKKRIEEIEAELGKLEAEFKELEEYFAHPEGYGDADELKAATRRHGELKKMIPELTDEWERLSLEAELKRQEFEEAKKKLEAEYER
jgi:ATP-binding cassette subfamily F protein 3